MAGISALIQAESSSIISRIVTESQAGYQKRVLTWINPDDTREIILPFPSFYAIINPISNLFVV